MTNIQCPKCHASVMAESRYCPKCGQLLSPEPQCPACGAPNPAGAYFCARCGAALAAAGAQPGTGSGGYGATGFAGGANTGGYGGTGSGGGYGDKGEPGGANGGGYGGTGGSGGYGGTGSSGGYGVKEQPGSGNAGGYGGGSNSGGYGGTGSGGGYGGGANTGGYGGTGGSGGYGGTGSSGGYGDPLEDDLEDSLTRRIEKRMQGIQERIDQRLGKGEVEEPAKAFSGTPPSAAAAHARPAEPAAGPPEPPLIHDSELNALVNLDPGESRQAMGLIRNSRMIEGNPLYNQRANKITFFFYAGDPSVNAFATDYPLGLSNGSQIQPPALVFCAGLGRAFHLASAAMAVYLCNRNDATLRHAVRDLGQCIMVNEGSLPQEAYAEKVDSLLIPILNEQLARGDERFLSLAQSIRLSMYLEVLAHEVGHVVLGHTLGQACNYDVSRNQEREADSVASSILSTCPYREYHFLGQILGNIIFVWMDEGPRGPERPTTHPLSRERFNNAFVCNSDAARDAERTFGLSRAKLEALLPQ